VIPALPTFIIIGVGGTLLLARRKPRALLARTLLRSLTAAALLLFPIFWVVGAGVYAQDVRSIETEMVVAAHWLNQHVPVDQLLAVHDIGAVGFFASSPQAPRPILDLAGLVSPEVITLFRDPAGILDLMKARGVRYLMVLPPQWEELWLGQPERWAGQFCLRFNANGLMNGMRIYEFVSNGCS
jgi:hypothetical protein